MASKQPFKLIDFKAMAIKLWLNTSNFVKYSLLMQKKQLLVIGDPHTDVYREFTQRLKSGWTVQTLTEEQLAIQQADAIKIEGQKDKVSHYYSHLAEKYKGNVFESIVVLPSSPREDFDFSDESFITKYPSTYLNSTIKNVFAYQLASKYLSKTGVIILSSNEKEFLSIKPEEFQQYGRGKEKSDIIRESVGKYNVSHYLCDGATAYLGLIMGERYDTSLNSHSVIALSSELSMTQPAVIAAFYENWVNKRRLPHPGSFARFQPPSEKATSYFVQYL